ncbi:hypothetical protein [Galbibacter pacificus]|uniref:KOW motif-containing protein n=1 Tax=Galbibacter pacificus TaxID=2996052 RepID=A0ABT6FQF2_9FLAO|nr:hypothetical protein [Galbibacter pacificus]MDG3582032.1 hypothetical protein [Galbibacter pacificus]MDG3585494.1 hypothetical protein [Galbibacter pacificus]
MKLEKDDLVLVKTDNIGECGKVKSIHNDGTVLKIELVRKDEGGNLVELGNL